MDTRKLAKRFPYPIQQGLKYAYGSLPLRLRYGRVFWDTYNFLQESQWWSKEKLEEYQMQQLNKLLNHAYANVPYYRRVFDERGLKPKDIQDFADLKKLPYLTKDIIQENLPDLVARNYSNSRLRYATTGGSNGIPLGFYVENGFSNVKELAFMLTQWNRIGFRMGDRCVVLRDNVVRSTSKGNLWEYDPVNKNLILSSYHLTEENMPKYIHKIREFKPDFIQAYPSVITILARFMKENNVEPFFSVKALLCGSETLYSWQRKSLAEAFQCRVYSWYGHSEMAVLAGECEKSTNYHIFSEYGYVELVGTDGKPVTGESEMREIIATGFNNYAMPFIRYRTMDLAVPGNGECMCGRNYLLLKKVEERLQDLIITKDNRFVTLTALIFAQHFEVFFKVKEMQLIQEKCGEITVRIVKTPQYSSNDEREILLKMKKAVGSGLNIQFNYVDFIPRTESGKYRFLIQKLPIEFEGTKDFVQEKNE